MRVFGVVGYKNTGKTGLMERLVTEITGARFYRLDDETRTPQFRRRSRGQRQLPAPRGRGVAGAAFVRRTAGR